MIAPKVLLVDDEESFVDVVAKRLSLRGFDTLTALSGKAALELLDTVPNVEVVVLDLKMPGLDGIETSEPDKKRSPVGGGDNPDRSRHCSLQYRRHENWAPTTI